MERAEAIRDVARMGGCYVHELLSSESQGMKHIIYAPNKFTVKTIGSGKTWEEAHAEVKEKIEALPSSAKNPEPQEN